MVVCLDNLFSKSNIHSLRYNGFDASKNKENL